MSGELSPDARRIIEAGITAAKSRSPSEALVAADRAVERAIGLIGLEDPANAEIKMFDPLVEIAQLHVRSQLSETGKEWPVTSEAQHR
jgi:hypothetical protein